MIYTARYKSLKKCNQHDEAIKLLSVGLKIEENINYFNESVLVNHFGKPSLKNHPDIYFSISHCKNYIAVIISKKYQVGIDVEDIKNFSPAVAKKVCTPKELKRIYSCKYPRTEFFKHWTLKESYVKAVGMGMSYCMKNIVFDEISKTNIISNKKDYKFLLYKEDKYIVGICYGTIEK